MILLCGEYAKIKKFCDDKMSKNYYEFDFSYVQENERFREIDRFLWESKHRCTRFKNLYYGPVVIGLNEWNDGKFNKYFDAFMYFLKDYLDAENKCIFYVEEAPDKALINALEKHFNIKEKYVGTASKKIGHTSRIGFYINEDERDDRNV